MDAPLKLPPDVGDSWKAVREAIRSLEFLRRDVAVILHHVPDLKTRDAVLMSDATGRIAKRIAAFVAGRHYKWRRHAEELRSVTRPLFVEFTAVRDTPYQVGKELFPCAGEALYDFVYRIAFAVHATADQTGGISGFVRRVAPESWLATVDSSTSAEIFFWEHYRPEEIEQSGDLKGGDEYIQRNALQPMKNVPEGDWAAPEEVWARLANAPHYAPVTLGMGTLCRQLRDLLALMKDRSDWDLRALKMESRIEHAKAASARPTSALSTLDFRVE